MSGRHSREPHARGLALFLSQDITRAAVMAGRMTRIQRQRLADADVVGGVELVFGVCYRGGASLVGGNIALKHCNRNPSDNL